MPYVVEIERRDVIAEWLRALASEFRMHQRIGAAVALEDALKLIELMPRAVPATPAKRRTARRKAAGRAKTQRRKRSSSR